MMIGKNTAMDKVFRVAVVALFLWNSQPAKGTESTNVTGPTETVVISGEDNRDPEPNEFNPAEYFDKIWGIIKDEFWDPNFNGVDWVNARKRYRPKVIDAENHESFAEIINQMLAELKTSHTRYYTKFDPGYYILRVVFGNPDTHRSGIGVVTKKTEGRYYVIAALHSSPAEEAGVLFGDWLVEADGRPFHPIRSFVNKAGTEIELVVQQGPSESTRKILRVTPLDMKEKDRLSNDSHASLETIEYRG
ncbi:MAG: S41 family peptidase, partial [Planctomycetota bacterium]